MLMGFLVIVFGIWIMMYEGAKSIMRWLISFIKKEVLHV